MAAPVSLRVEGLARLTRELTELGVELDDLKDTMKEIGDAALDTIIPSVPVRSGALKASLRSGRAKNKATVIAGRKRVAYAPIVNYGRDGKSGARFLQQADQHTARWATMLSEGIDRLIREKGLQ